MIEELPKAAGQIGSNYFRWFRKIQLHEAFAEAYFANLSPDPPLRVSIRLSCLSEAETHTSVTEVNTPEVVDPSGTAYESSIRTQRVFIATSFS